MSESLFGLDDLTISSSKVKYENVAKIVVIGVGGGGCNMVNYMASNHLYKGVDLVAANTDIQALNVSKAKKTLQLGKELTKGLGAGMKPEVGKEAALESFEEIKGVLNGSDIVFIASGLGGGTGTGAASIVASAAKEVGSLVVCVVTTPFKWEGKVRAGLASIGLEQLKQTSDSVIVIPNDRITKIITEQTSIKDAFKPVDDILYQAVNGMSGIILKQGENDINTDFADVKTVMQHRGIALMGIGKAQGENAPKEALENAIRSPLLDEMPLGLAKGLIIHWTIPSSLHATQIFDVMEEVNDMIEGAPDIIFGTTTSDEFESDEVKITIVATGFDSSDVRECRVPTNTKAEDGSFAELDNSIDGEIDVIKNKSYYETPPLMRGYNIKNRLS